MITCNVNSGIIYYLIVGKITFILILTMLNILSGIIHLTFWHCPLSVLGISRLELEVGQPTL